MAGGKWRVCSRAWVNVLLEIPSKGYGLHGHDVLVEACVEGERSGVFLVDIEELRSRLEELLSPVNGRRLSEALGKSEAALEDLVLYVCNSILESIEEANAAYAEASVPSGSVAVECRG